MSELKNFMRKIAVGSLLGTGLCMAGSPMDGLRTAGLLHFSYQDGGFASNIFSTTQHSGSNTFGVGQLTVFLDSDVSENVFVTAEIQSDLYSTAIAGQTPFRLRSGAVTFTNLAKWRTNLQVGKFNTVFGSFVHRRLPIDNPLMDAPLAYSHYVNLDLSAGWVPPDATVAPVRQMTLVDRDLTATGIKIFNSIRKTKLSYAASITNNASGNQADLNVNNSLNAALKLHWQADHNTSFGVSYSQGSYMNNLVNLLPGTPEPVQTLYIGATANPLDTSAYRQTMAGLHFNWEKSRYKIYSEYISSVFDVPNNPADANLSADAVYVEGKYNFTKNIFGAARFDSMNFENKFYTPITAGITPLKWDDDIKRVEVGVGNFINESTLAKLTYQTTDYDRQTYSRDFNVVSGAVSVIF